MMPIEDDELEKQFDEFSDRLDTRIQEFKEHGRFSLTTENSGHHASTGEVLFERFLELLRDLDARTLKCNAQDHCRTEE
jgi:hypothetical protein